METNETIALLFLLGFAVAAGVFTLVVVVAVDRSGGEQRGEGGQDSDENGARKGAGAEGA